MQLTNRHTCETSELLVKYEAAQEETLKCSCVCSTLLHDIECAFLKYFPQVLIFGKDVEIGASIVQLEKNLKRM